MTAPDGPGPPDLPGIDPTRPPSAFMEATGLRVERATPEGVEGSLVLGPEHHQPAGIVHGGVYCSAIEQAASIGAALFAADRGLTAVGTNNNTHFLRPVVTGEVRVVARPVQRGRTQQLWQVEVTDTEDRLVATGQVRLANVELRT